MTRLLKVLLLALIAGPLHAETTSGEAGYQIDSIYDLDTVRDIELDGASGSVLITLQDRVVKFDSFPLLVTADVPLQIEGITSVLHRDESSNQDILVVMGDQSEQSNGYSGGAILYYNGFSESLTNSSEPEEFKSGNAPFSQALLTADGTIFGVNPRWFSILRTSVQGMTDYVSGESEVYLPSDLFLQCGSASQLTVFQHKASKKKEPQEYYLTSVVGSKRIEYGPVLLDTPNLPDSNCFDPYRSRTSQTKGGSSLGERALIHEVVEGDPPSEDRWQVAKYLLTFNTEGGELTVYPIRELKGSLTILRSESISYDLNPHLELKRDPATFSGLMSADDAGSVVLAAYVGADRVHRLQQVDGELEYVGYFNVPKQVKNLQVSNDGKLAAISTGELGRDRTEELILINHPANVPANVTDFGNERFSVTQLQQMLSDSGYVLKTDGIYGEETKTAIDKFLTDPEQSQEPEQKPIVVRSILTSVRNEESTGATVDEDTVKRAVELDRVIRGLLPLKEAEELK